MTSKISHAKSVNHIYQNPIFLAKEYRKLIDSGEAKNQTDLARKLGTSKVHVCRVLSLLKLNDELLYAVEQIGNPMHKRIITVRMLQECLKSSEMYDALLSRLKELQK